MFQSIIAIIIILGFLGRLIWQKKKAQINKNEFRFWLVFWLLALVVILGLKWLDQLVAGLGFSSSGIQVLLYAAVAVIFYFIGRLRLRLAKMERDISKIVEHFAIDSKDKN
jgi:hypothetical protein